ncbi:hypothetical protein C0991_008025 [Blastosporella zonata]|nr:hypothetical protein C0991_008025 [Blastosporella zonata]
MVRKPTRAIPHKRARVTQNKRQSNDSAENANQEGSDENSKNHKGKDNNDHKEEEEEEDKDEEEEEDPLEAYERMQKQGNDDCEVHCIPLILFMPLLIFYIVSPNANMPIMGTIHALKTFVQFFGKKQGLRSEEQTVTQSLGMSVWFASTSTVHHYSSSIILIAT